MSQPSPEPDPSGLPQIEPSDRDRVARLMVLAMYGLLLLSVPVPALPMIVALGLAYGTRREAPALWRSHFDEGIRTIWLYVILMLIAWPLWYVFFLGVVPMAAAYLILVFRAARGLIRASRWMGV